MKIRTSWPQHADRAAPVSRRVCESTEATASPCSCIWGRGLVWGGALPQGIYSDDSTIACKKHSVCGTDATAGFCFFFPPIIMTLTGRNTLKKKCLSKQAMQRNGSGRAKHTPNSCFISKTRSIALLTFALTSPCLLSTPGPHTWPFYDCCKFFGWFPPWQTLHCSVTDTHAHTVMWKAFCRLTRPQLHAKASLQYACRYMCSRTGHYHTHHRLKTNQACSASEAGGRGWVSLGGGWWWRWGEATSCFEMQKCAPGLG